ncbi:MAG: peptide methionine sulfoxide reductase [Gimesia sp.]|uniref:GIY-YIG nuclease family protein n=1 Tax=Gimesia sp. TaxID=2024833 RepID=UPI000C3A2D2D|nr:GIY-YIG nuclease family protein [Gimesia sp.]MAX35786.1 peptide methionine sulfoxide reductase [Gimesia sp.]|tara:strand:+ start:6869 stop:7750 length:882 start_codon:yes stop_codon:yes gene_type:complete
MPDNHQRPFSIRIFIPDGDPDGLRLVEKSNWTGIGVVFNRSIFKQVVSRPEFERTGVYVLIGTSDDSSMPTIYVGESDVVKKRLGSHYSQKDFWDWAIFFVTKDSSLNKAHVKHLEARLLELAKAAKQCKLYSDQPSFPPTLSEAETADVESFLLDMLSIFPLLGLSIFEKTETSIPPQNLLYIKGRGSEARGYEDPKGFVVVKGSQIAPTDVPSQHQYAVSMRRDLKEQGVIVDDQFIQDHVFKSPSTAGCVVTGRTTNGRDEWKLEDGTTLKQLQDEISSVAETEESTGTR